MPKAAGRWSTCEITARGERLVVVLKGVQSVSVLFDRLSTSLDDLQVIPSLSLNRGPATPRIRLSLLRP
jgi:hypothetical protein